MVKSNTNQGKEMSNAVTNQTIDMGNNERMNRGVFAQPDGTWLAMTLTRSQFFKTRKGAERAFLRWTA
jgi:hypothetical protein